MMTDITDADTYTSTGDYDHSYIMPLCDPPILDKESRTNKIIAMLKENPGEWHLAWKSLYGFVVPSWVTHSTVIQHETDVVWDESADSFVLATWIRYVKTETASAADNYDTVVVELTATLAEGVRANGYKVAESSPTSLGWLRDIDKLVEEFGAEEVRRVMALALNDTFWQQNIRSPAKFRKHFERLAKLNAVVKRETANEANRRKSLETWDD